jgi:hypothetical protein
MNFGFINFYPYRPHGHHAEFLRKLVESVGHSTYSLDCKSSIPNCYLREVKGSGRSECIKCAFGSLSTFNFEKTESIRKYDDGSDLPVWVNPQTLVESSSYTLARIESEKQRESDDVLKYQDRLISSVKTVYSAVKNWIEGNGIQVVVLFNGRMDITRAALEACKELAIPCIIHERPLFGHGLILNLNENCSSLKKIHCINKEFSDKPLSYSQLKVACKLLAQRFRGENNLEWKRYNSNPSEVSRWPKNSDRKILICPSSKNELLGHPDWETPWSDNTDAIDLLFDQGKISPNECVVRFHPSWAVAFGKSDAKKCVEHYLNWCQQRGIYFYDSDSSVNTRDLIRLSDLVILNGSNTILEAGALGKPTLCLGPSPYSYSGCAEDILTVEMLKSLDIDSVINKSPSSIVRKTLRYAYSKAAREPLFVDHVRSTTVTECEFYSGADPKRVNEIINGELVVDDSSYSDSSGMEDEVVEKFLKWDVNFLEDAASFVWTASSSLTQYPVKRRGVLQTVDQIRNLFPKGI